VITGIVFITGLALAPYVRFQPNHASALTEKDTILLADFVNTAGDQVFDGALKQALASCPPFEAHALSHGSPPPLWRGARSALP
jgi:hypothetical protein